MKKLAAIIVILAALWGGYWWVGSSAVERNLKAWFEARREAGWVADYASLDTAGFPNRFDTTITDLDLADPETGLAWHAPFFQILQLSYTPHHVILALPHEQTLASPYETVTVGSSHMNGSVIFKPSTALELERTAFVMKEVTLAGETGWQAALDEGRLAARLLPGQKARYEIGFEALGLRPSQAGRDALDPGGVLPETVETLKLDAEVTFDRPWDRAAIEEARPQPTAIDLKTLRARWGKLDLRATGTLAVDEEGMPSGKITVKAENWREMLKMAVTAGLVPKALAPTIETGLGLLAGLSGGGESLDAPLGFRDGGVYLGPVPLGPAPRLALR